MKKILIGLLVGLFSITTFAESWFYIGTINDDGIDMYIDAEKLDLDYHKGWVKGVYPKKHKKYLKTLDFYSADCENNKIKQSNHILYKKNGERSYESQYHINQEYKSFPEKSGLAKIFECLCNEKIFHSKLGDINLKDLNNE